ncbi:DUF1656 domain-containing protein [Novosphingobium sp. BW1]|uniref:DUF1656 domain-containing protein n=1 Tax=Novosphingobium sp. BW1 TaxID=2592621 RepID=UPI0011DE7257|nr:DUF1656 domain-containing protein [Novosphingobium sp. BW1]TYC90668.1 DUF1656 domain-containing protein [Novosphingobium sp. BW1]
MTPDYLLGVIYVAAAPVEACIALVLTFLLHRLLSALRLYRWIWHAVLFDTALFVIVWAALVLVLPTQFAGSHP